jgi:hypothetical protein
MAGALISPAQTLGMRFTRTLDVTGLAAFADHGDLGRADCRALHSLRDTPPLALDDGHPRYLSGVPYLGTIRGAARRSSFALLAETTGGALGICGALLNNAGTLGLGFCVVGSNISREVWVSDFAHDRN